MLNLKKKINKGVGVVESLIAISIVSFSLLGVIAAYNFFISAAMTHGDMVKAVFLAEEGQEVVRLLRDQGWASIEVLGLNVNYFLAFDETEKSWALVTDSNVIDEIFERTVVFESVSRDINDKIVLSGGTLDPDIRKVEVRVSWNKAGRQNEKVLTTYISNLFRR
jgi:hypothetical protein